MFKVINRNNGEEPLNYNEISNHLNKLANIEPKIDTRYVSIDTIVIETIDDIGLGINGMKTSEINEHAAKVASARTYMHYGYDLIAGRLRTYNLHKEINYSFSEGVMKYNESIYKIDFIDFVSENAYELDKMIVSDRDYQYNNMAIETYLKSYLIRNKYGKVIETPQYTLMRVAVAIWRHEKKEYALEMIAKTYEAMSTFKYTHATPTIYNAGLKNENLISCYLQQLVDDSIPGIFETIKRTAILQKSCGGVATHIHNLRAKGSLINSSNRICDGINKPLRLLDQTAVYVDQGKRRPGANAIYIEPWHYEIFEFLQMAHLHTSAEFSAPNLFYAIWLPDDFLDAVRKGKDWYLMCPNVYPYLSDVYGKEFTELYQSYINKNKHKIINYEDLSKYRGQKDFIENGVIVKVKARDIFNKIIEIQQVSGKCYLLAKDQINYKSNQKNIGVIKSSNLCAEITLVSGPDEIATCCLASIKVSEYYKNGKFDFDELAKIVELAVINLNNVLDINDYPLKETLKSSMNHRAIGIGIQDLASLYMKMGVSYDSKEAKEMNKSIQEHIYYNALKKSCELAKKYKPYSTFAGSPASKGILQFDMWKEFNNTDIRLDPKLQWKYLKEDIKKYGLRNSTLLANMPTSGTSSIMNSFSEAFHPLISHIYVRKTASNEHQLINKYLVDALIKENLWSQEMATKIIRNDGNINNIQEIPKKIRDVFKTVRDHGMACVIDQRADSGPFCCQSQSMNIYPLRTTLQQLYTIYMNAWERGLKTIAYYVHSKAASKPYDITESKESKESKESGEICPIDCESCSA